LWFAELVAFRLRAHRSVNVLSSPTAITCSPSLPATVCWATTSDDQAVARSSTLLALHYRNRADSALIPRWTRQVSAFDCNCVGRSPPCCELAAAPSHGSRSKDLQAEVIAWGYRVKRNYHLDRAAARAVASGHDDSEPP
jgi:hypothetical protein